MTKLKLRGNLIEIDSRDEVSDAIVQTLSVRKLDRRLGVWYCPVEIVDEVVRKFDQIQAEIDPKVYSLNNKLSYLTDYKFKHVVGPDWDELLKTKPMEHQAQWLAYAQNFKSIANTSEQGTGKSKMALDWLTLKDKELNLLIVKNSNVYKWAQEVRKHSDFTPFVLKGTKKERTEKLHKACYFKASGQGPVVVIINYDYIKPFLIELMRVDWEAIVLDESTAIKSVRTKRYKAILRLSKNVKYKLILTGTPLVNSPVDGYGQFRFLKPGVFGTNFESFKQRYTIMGGYGGYQVLAYKNMDEFAQKIENFSFRILKAECLDLPPKQYNTMVISGSTDFNKEYKDLVNAEILSLGDRKVNNTLAIVKMMRCMQLCDGFLYEPDSDGKIAKRLKSPKEDVLIDFLEDHFKSTNKVVIWFHFRATMHILKDLIREKFPEAEVIAMNGDTPVKNRQDNIDAFNDAPTDDGKSRCLILQSAAFMHGIDVRCDTVIYYSRNYNNEEWLQTQDRIHGINRGGGSYANYIILNIDKTVERAIDMSLNKKKSLQEYLLKDVSELASFLKGVVHG